MRLLIIFGLCVLLTLAIVSVGKSSWEPATIVDVVGSLVTVETADGNLFEFYADNFDAEIGDEIEVKFASGNTKDRKDDRVVSVAIGSTK